MNFLSSGAVVGIGVCVPTEVYELSEDIDKSEAAIVFLHGLSGDAFDTWTYGDSKEAFWPQWIASDYPELAVFSIGYDAEFVGHSQFIHERANNILASLRSRRIFQDKPFVFVVHSLGGLVAKDIVLAAASSAPNNKRNSDILSRFQRDSIFCDTA